MGDAASRVSTERNCLGLNRIDLLIVAAYLAGITLFGLRFRKRQRTMRDYFLAGRNIPWWAIALSIVAAETSTLTIISIPGLAYDSNFTFLQLVMGYVIGRVIISFVLLPQYFRGELYTAYQLIERRFGPELRTVTAGLFLLTRAAAEGVRVYAVSIVVSIALGTGEVASIAIIMLLTLIYTFEGGLAAVIWTDVVQTFIYVGGTLVGMVTILHLVPGGWASVEAIASGLHKFQVFDLSLFNSAVLVALAVFESCETVHPVGGDYWRRILHDGQPWYRPAHRAEIAGGAESAAVNAGAGVEWIGCFFSVWIVSFGGRDAVRLLPGSVGGVWAGG